MLQGPPGSCRLPSGTWTGRPQPPRVEELFTVVELLFSDEHVAPDEISLLEATSVLLESHDLQAAAWRHPQQRIHQMVLAQAAMQMHTRMSCSGVVLTDSQFAARVLAALPSIKGA